MSSVMIVLTDRNYQSVVDYYVHKLSKSPSKAISRSYLAFDSDGSYSPDEQVIASGRCAEARCSGINQSVRVNLIRSLA